MAVGDVVTDIINVTAGAPVNFQPAAGISIMLTGYIADDSNNRYLITDGSAEGHLCVGQTILPQVTSIKWFINNGHYLKMKAAASTIPMGYTGIQIQ